MAAEKVADHILGRALPPDHAAAAATWVDPEWRTRQRGGRRCGACGTGSLVLEYTYLA